MKCEDVLTQLPDYVLGTQSETDRAAIRSHLRGCSSCRTEAARLDEGVALFATAAHEVEPPPELEATVMGVLSEEWDESRTQPRMSRFLGRRWVPLAAAAAVLVGLAAWGTIAQVGLNRNAEDADAYRSFLATLGGREVRVAALEPVGDSGVEGSAILYESDREQSWALVLVRNPGYVGRLFASLVGPKGRVIELFPIEIEQDGDGATWLVTSADISRFDVVRVRLADGTMVAKGTFAHDD